ncbi:Seven transmembrane domain-containing tyrosine-protein kinase 1 [Geodia barretti]|uniref:Seven transmembrane domain-containing tyrosine-protein kinase 1 n=1 Tax=Geodia barretti TaxID=519541 RepID=A0AA35T1Y0_GEOBA|nr:Seven transmembrane domain-containing tyrosine-protein kinase 1 [Geodia barretti]
MDVAARVSHPNLLRFLGARLEGGMAILTEFMPTSLRALVNRRPRQLLSLEHILSIDVSRALNYLHNMSPDPIIHRDLSSANVLLQPSPDGGWLAKVSDYGTANFQSQLQTVNPGSPVYTAPESRDPALQTPKMDIYSFGVLLVEMCTCDFPAPERRAELMESIDYTRLLNLIRQCQNVDKDRRPTAAQLVELLQAMPLVTRTHM